MKLLIASATYEEIKTLKRNFDRIPSTKHSIDFLITGIGQMHTCFSLTKKLQNASFDLLIQAGICGSVSNKNNIGEMIQIIEDEIIDIGSTSSTEYIPMDLKKFARNGEQTQTHCFAPKKTISSNLLDNIKKGKGITSNTAHGDSFWVGYIKQNHPNTFESMEGAASFFIGNQFEIPVIQIRSVSNFVELRNLANWNIEKAIQNLNRFLIQFIDEL